MTRISRDTQFYAEDGDCVVRVEDTLFNVSRAVLSRNSTAFREFFRSYEGLPPEQIPGTSEECPIDLARESPENFRTICRIFQLSPNELQLHLYRDPKILPDLHRLHSVLERYGCTSYADWVRAAISQHYNPPTCPPDGAFTLITGCPGTRALVISAPSSRSVADDIITIIIGGAGQKTEEKEPMDIDG
ncbi:hypothetical protein FB451DRAFT_1407192 [Mycena latifolia]|nr:hypothetical protein FB451DRAFT_1407192 [Mycena latifolia]